MSSPDRASVEVGATGHGEATPARSIRWRTRGRFDHSRVVRLVRTTYASPCPEASPAAELANPVPSAASAVVVADPRLEIVLAEALRALTHQQALLDNLRSRATLLTTAAALVISFPGVSALTGREQSGVSIVLASTGLVGVLTCTLVVCAPWWRWRFRASAVRLIQAVDDGHDVNSIRRHLARDFERWLDHNDRRIRTLQWWFTAGLVLLSVEVAAWTGQLVAEIGT
jgi:hypothetical protein